MTPPEPRTWIVTLSARPQTSFGRSVSTRATRTLSVTGPERPARTRFLPVCRIATVQVDPADAVASNAMRRQARARARQRPGRVTVSRRMAGRAPVGPFTTARQLRLASQRVPRYHHVSRAGALSRACTGAAWAATSGV